MPWNFMQIELVPADRLVRPMIGPGSLTRDQAHAEIQSILDRGADANPLIAQTAVTWRRGAKDNTAYAGPFVWCIYEHPDGENPRKGALAWAEDFAQTIRSTGVNVQVAKLPE